MTARETAFKILLKFEQTGQHLDILTDRALNNDVLSSKEKKFVSNLVSGAIRFRSLFDWKIATLYSGNYKKALLKFKIILRLAIYEIDFLDFIPPHATANEYVNLAKKELPKSFTSSINAIIRTYLREGKSLKPEKKFKYDDTRIAIQFSFPEWLVKRWLGTWDRDFVSEMCRALNERPTFDIRVNESKIKLDEFKNILFTKKVDFTQSTHFSQVFKVSDIQKLRQLKLFSDGYCSVQDESGIIVTKLMESVSPGDRILDACTAPGGKFTAIHEKHQGEIFLYGHDINLRRLKIVKGNCRRLGSPDCLLVNGDAQKPPFNTLFDHILIDAPCSGFGTIQKHPDIKWRRSLEQILRFQQLQLSILSKLSKYLKQGGFLTYSTCTIEPSENEIVIDEFIKNQSSKFRIIFPSEELKPFRTDEGYIRTFPHIHDMEGSFSVKLQKIK
jgi:16S rRNA (cytosine967-C5)-methyltransferase